MRQIKFRAWSESLKQMFYSDNPDHEFNLSGGNMVVRVWQDKGVLIAVPAPEVVPIPEGTDIEDAVVMQFTGLLDKNGKEIYEGDIVTAGTKIGEVVYHEERAMWIIQDQFFFNEPLCQFIVEVSGNKFEHPHLLNNQ